MNANTNSPEFITAIRAIHEAVWRFDVAINEIQITTEAPGNIMAIILQEAGKEAVSVALNALETISDLGIDRGPKTEEEDRVFENAFQKLKAGPIASPSKVA